MATSTHPELSEVHLVVKYTGAQTATEVVGAPGAGYAIDIASVFWSSSADSENTLHDEDDNLIFGQFVPANGGREHSPGRGAVRVAENKAVEITTTAGNTYLELYYVVRTV